MSDIHISTLAIVNGHHTLYIFQCIIYSIHISTHCEWTSYIVQLYNCRFHTFTILWEEVSTTVRKNCMPWQDLPGQLCPKNVTILIGYQVLRHLKIILMGNQVFRHCCPPLKIILMGYQVLRHCCPSPNLGPCREFFQLIAFHQLRLYFVVQTGGGQIKPTKVMKMLSK